MKTKRFSVRGASYTILTAILMYATGLPPAPGATKAPPDENYDKGAVEQIKEHRSQREQCQTGQTSRTSRTSPSTVFNPLSTVNCQLSIVKNPFRYSGYYHDAESGMDYCQARYYSPATGRFTTIDTYDLPNRYAYCEGDPVSNIDPDGHDSVSPWILGSISFVFDIGAAHFRGASVGLCMCGSALFAAGANIIMLENAGKMDTNQFLSVGFTISSSIVGLVATNPEIFSAKMQGAVAMSRCLKDGLIIEGKQAEFLEGYNLAYGRHESAYSKLLLNKQVTDDIKWTKEFQTRMNLNVNMISQALGGIGNAITLPASDKNDFLGTLAFGAVVGAGTGGLYGLTGEAGKWVEGKIGWAPGKYGAGLVSGFIRSGSTQLLKDICINGDSNIKWNGELLAASLGCYSFVSQRIVNTNSFSFPGKLAFSLYRTKKDLVLNAFIQQN